MRPDGQQEDVIEGYYHGMEMKWTRIEEIVVEGYHGCGGVAKSEQFVETSGWVDQGWW